MIKNQMLFIKYFILVLIGIIAISQIFTGNIDFGAGLLAGIIIVGIALGIKSRRINQMIEKGMEPYDERVWTIAGKASYISIRVFVLISALIVLIGSIWGPVVLVNPYNLLGISLTSLMLLYITFYYYYNYKL